MATNNDNNHHVFLYEVVINPKMGQVEVPWWVEIITTRPHCIYYFGPFDSFAQAYNHQGGYVEDLQEEGAIGIIINIKQCQPLVLTQELEEETSTISKSNY